MYYFCFGLAMVVPVMMFVVGVKWWLNPPAYKSKGLVYRTEATERGPEVWRFAHTHCGKLWGRFGAILLVLSILLLVLLKESYQKYILWLFCGQMLVLCITVVMIDILSKHLYDENGEAIHYDDVEK